MKMLLSALQALFVMLAVVGNASAQTVTMGETAILSSADNGNGNLLLAQEATLSTSATLQSMAFYVTQAAGNLVLGVYDASGPSGRPGKLMAQTAEFAPTTGWNVASTTTSPTLAAGQYWLAYFPSTNDLNFVKENNTGPCWYYSLQFTAVLPTTFATKTTSCTPTMWSLYATLSTTATPSLSLTDSPMNPSVMSSSAPGTVVTSLTAAWNNGAAFTGTYAFTTPYNNDGNLFAFDSSAPNNVVVMGTLASLGGTTQNVTVQAQQGGTSSNAINVPIAVTSPTPPPPPPPPPVTDPTSGLLPSDRDAYANWAMAGLQSVGGIPNRTTVCATVTPTGTDPADVNAIQAAVNACPVGEVVSLAAGTFLIQDGNFVFLNKGVTIRGAGPCAAVATFAPRTGYGNMAMPPTGVSQVSGCTLIARTDGAYYDNQGGSVWSPHIQMGSNEFDNSFSTTTLLAAEATPGSYTIQVASTSGFSVGQQVLLAEHSNFEWQSDWVYGGQVWAAPDFRISGSAHYPAQQSDQYSTTPPTAPSIPCYFGFNNGNNTNCDLYVNETKQIASIGAGPCPGTNCTVTFDSPVMISYRVTSPYNALLANFTQPWTTYAGVEGMTLQNADYAGLRMLLCAYCWVKNVEDDLTAQGSIWIIDGFRDQVEEVYDHYAAYPFIGGGGYFWTLDNGSSELLVQNSISMLADKVMVMRESGGGSVFAYNYFDDGFCADYGCGDWLGSGFVSIESGANASHWMGTHHVLFEGNWMFNGSGDGSWGSNPFNTWFGNYAPGARTKFTDYINNTVVDDINNIPGGNAPLRAASLAQNYYWNSYIGNVLGISGKTTAANGWHYLSYIDQASIFYLGATLGNSGGNGGDPEEVCDISAPSPTCIGTSYPLAANCVSESGDKCPEVRNINYDYYNNAVVYDPNNSDHTLPNSFVFGSAPAFFGNGSGYTWPWVTPQGSSQLRSGPTTATCTANVGGPCSGLPAKARIDNGTPFAQP
jgi:hypothetical protein